MPKFYHKIISPDSALHAKLRYLYEVHIKGYHKKLHQQIRQAKPPINVVIGAGDVPIKGWILTDYPMVDATSENDWKKFFTTKKIDHLLAEHVMEHLTVEQNDKLIGLAAKYLNSGGTFRIAVPDGYHASPEYREYCKPGGTGPGGHDHKVFWNYQTLGSLLKKHGFEIQLLEYFDENGNYFSKPFNDEWGLIRRSRAKGYQSVIKDFSSLIIDAIKK